MCLKIVLCPRNGLTNVRKSPSFFKISYLTLATPAHICLWDGEGSLLTFTVNMGLELNLVSKVGRCFSAESNPAIFNPSQLTSLQFCCNEQSPKTGNVNLPQAKGGVCEEEILPIPVRMHAQQNSLLARIPPNFFLYC